MDKLSNEISFSSDSPQQVEPVRGSGTSATSHLLVANRINVRACHVRSGVAMQLNTKCQHKHQQGALQGCFYTACGVGWYPAAFSSVIGSSARHSCRSNSPHEPDSGRWRQAEPWTLADRQGCWQTDRLLAASCRRSYGAQEGPEDYPDVSRFTQVG